MSVQSVPILWIQYELGTSMTYLQGVSAVVKVMFTHQVKIPPALWNKYKYQ